MTKTTVDLTGRTALITGATRGLGNAIAEAFAAAGADLLVVSRHLDACISTAEELESKFGRRAAAYACHMGRWQDVDGLVAAAYAEFGKIDILVNNAGMSPVYDALADVDEALYDKVLDVNLKGVYRLTTLVGARMKRDTGGSIVNVSSYASLSPKPEFLPYSVAKAGVNALTVGFARAFGPEVRVNCIVAGPFKTDVSKHWTPEIEQRYQSTYALGRAGEQSEIAGAALYFASDMSTFTTGALLRVDGGAP
jgi:NAD(P)-dependent dehydrogenase (short-subunit alcohol dehydrogenase family)